MALVNREVLLEYNVAGPRLWHDRLVMEHVANDTYVVLTPDGDIYAEDLGLLNPDVRAIRVRPGPRRVPAGLVAAEIYAMPAWTANQLNGYRDEARRVADQERGALAGGPLAAAAVGAQAPAAVVAGARVAEQPAFDRHEGFAEGSLKWLAAETYHGYQHGQEVAGVGAGLVKGAKLAFNLPSGGVIFVECVDGSDYFKFLQKPSRGDPRILEVELNALGQPERGLKDVASLCKEVKVRWALAGPRTAKWCVNYLAVEGLGFEGHHERLRQVTRADASSWGIQEHFQVSMSLRQALLVDQLDAFNLLSIEIQFRRLQTIEYSYSEKAREQESKAVGGRLSLEEQTSFGGVTRQFSTLMICPDLLDHVKLETEKEASLAKNLRKAREERELARKGKKGDKQTDP